jgi:hypothetical protein
MILTKKDDLEVFDELVECDELEDFEVDLLLTLEIWEILCDECSEADFEADELRDQEGVMT